MRILFLNQYFPPDPAPTGLLLRELADDLESNGHAVDLVHARQDYRAGQTKGGRVRREASATFRMLGVGLARPHADLVVSGSSPPCLLVTATIIARRHRAKSIHWAMDLYPELAVALGELRPSLFFNWIIRMMRKCYRRTDRVIALDEDMATHLRGFGIEPRIIRPWVPRSMVDDSATPPESPWTWIYSGNLGRAHDWKTLLDAQAILEQRGADIRLVFQGSGPSRPAAQARARELQLRRCEWKDYVPGLEVRASILRCHCAVVSQRPIAQGLLWPSKLALLLTIPRPILWVGPTEGAIARELRALPLTGIFASGEASAIAEWLLALRAGAQTVSACDRIDPLAHRNAAVAAWRDIILST